MCCLFYEVCFFLPGLVDLRAGNILGLTGQRCSPEIHAQNTHEIQRAKLRFRPKPHSGAHRIDGLGGVDAVPVRQGVQGREHVATPAGALEIGVELVFG